MRRDFKDALRDARAVRGALAACVFALGAYADVFESGVRERATMIWRDLAFAARSMRKTPLFALVVVVTFAVAIGANATAFSILRAVVLNPLPFREPAQLVSVTGTFQGKPFALSIPDFEDLRAHNRAFSAMAAYTFSHGWIVTGHGPARSLFATDVSIDFFDVLGSRPFLGRFFVRGDARVGSPRTIVISYVLWRELFGNDSRAVGEELTLSGTPYRIVGVAPEGFSQPDNDLKLFTPNLWFPLQPASTEYKRGEHYAQAIGRLRPGRTLAQGRSDLGAIFTRLAARYPADDRRDGVAVQSLNDAVVGSIRPLLFAIFAAVGIVLLVACANVANLLLSRGASREREFAIRSAVGASRGRIVAQVFTETFLLVGAGGAAGIALAYVATRGFAILNPSNIPRAQNATLDLIGVIYTFGIVALCTLGAGLVPALARSSPRAANALKAAGRTQDASGGSRLRGGLVVAEIALSLTLVATSALVVRSYVVLTDQNVGFDATDVLVSYGLTLPDHDKSDASVIAALGDIERRVRALPGVGDVALAFSAPFSQRNFDYSFHIVGRAALPGAAPDAFIDYVGSAYFRLLHVPVLQGRAFDEQDRYGAAPVAIVNQALARKYFSSGKVIGAHIDLREFATDRPEVKTIVGVVGDTRDSYRKPASPELYVPLSQVPFHAVQMLIAAAPHGTSTKAIGTAVTAVDPLIPAPPVHPLAADLAADAATERLNAMTLAALALIAFTLAIGGIYAVVSYAVTQRTHELGVRMALGARAAQIVRGVVSRAMRIAGIGILIGIVIAAFAARAMAAQLYGITPFDPLTFAVVIAAIVLASTLAALVPARRATRVDPIVALRYE